mmetsp:Transcript_8646/g.28875  ORF Transcript_8646/g.28875 Transcript_8646/m.28875 type:complete len:415 (+) Transcript_8646:149-1393(+)
MAFGAIALRGVPTSTGAAARKISTAAPDGSSKGHACAIAATKRAARPYVGACMVLKHAAAPQKTCALSTTTRSSSTNLNISVSVSSKSPVSVPASAADRAEICEVTVLVFGVALFRCDVPNPPPKAEPNPNATVPPSAAAAEAHVALKSASAASGSRGTFNAANTRADAAASGKLAARNNHRRASSAHCLRNPGSNTKASGSSPTRRAICSGDQTPESWPPTSCLAKHTCSSPVASLPERAFFEETVSASPSAFSPRRDSTEDGAPGDATVFGVPAPPHVLTSPFHPLPMEGVPLVTKPFWAFKTLCCSETGNVPDEAFRADSSGFAASACVRLRRSCWQCARTVCSGDPARVAVTACSSTGRCTLNALPCSAATSANKITAKSGALIRKRVSPPCLPTKFSSSSLSDSRPSKE